MWVSCVSFYTRMCVCCGASTFEIFFFDHAVDDRQPRRVACCKEQEALVADGHSRVQKERVSLQESIVVWREVGVQAFENCQQKKNLKSQSPSTFAIECQRMEDSSEFLPGGIGSKPSQPCSWLNCPMTSSWLTCPTASVSKFEGSCSSSNTSSLDGIHDTLAGSPDTRSQKSAS